MSLTLAHRCVFISADFHLCHITLCIVSLVFIQSFPFVKGSVLHIKFGVDDWSGCRVIGQWLYKHTNADTKYPQRDENTLQWHHNEHDGVSNPQTHHTHPFIQMQIKENIKALCHWPLCGEFTGYRWIPAQRASNVESVSIWWRHHEWQLNLMLAGTYESMPGPVLSMPSLEPYFDIKTNFPGIGILIVKIRLSWDCFIFIMGLPILVWQHLYSIDSRYITVLYNSILRTAQQLQS